MEIIRNFFLEKQYYIRNNKKLQEYVKGENKILNLINNQYTLLNVDEVLCYDITVRGHIHVIMLIEMSSRYIIGLSLLWHEPSAKDIIDLIKIYIHKNKNIKTRKIVIHADCAGENSADEIREFAKQEGIILSFSYKFVGNHISECRNEHFWRKVEEICIEGYESASFFDLTYDLQLIIATKAVHEINRNISKTSKVLPLGASSEEMYQAGILYRYPSKNIILAANGTNKANEINVWKRTQIMLKRNLAKEVELNTKKKIIFGLAQTPDEFRENFKPENLDFNIIKKKEKEVSIEYKTYNELSKLKSNEIYGFIEHWSQTPEAKNTTNYEKIMLLLNIRNGQKIDEINDSANQLKETLQETIIKLDKVSKDQDSGKQILENLQHITNCIVKKRKNRENLKRNINKIKKAKIEDAIYPENFELVLQQVPSFYKYQYHRDKIAHAVLKCTGMRIGNLIHVDIPQLKAFFNYELMIVKGVQHVGNFYLKFKFTKESAGKIIDMVREDWLELQKILINKGYDLEEEINFNNPRESIIWGPTKLKRSSNTRRLKGQLRKAIIILNKTLRNNGYGKDIA